MSTSHPPLVCIIILNWNGKDLLEVCLSSLFKNTRYKNFKVLLVDNGSTDGSVEFVRKNFPSVEILALDKNYGFAGGNNRGIFYVMKKYKPDYVLLLNNDVEFIDPSWLEKLVESAEENEKIGIIGCKLLNRSGSEEYSPGFLDPKMWVVGNMRRIEKRIKDTKGEVKSVAFACVLIKKDVIEKIGYLDEDFFPAGCEDTDYCLRAKAAGFRVFVNWDVSVLHLGGATTKRKTREDKIFRELLAKNGTQFALLHLPFYLIPLWLCYEIYTSFFVMKEPFRPLDPSNLSFNRDFARSLWITLKAWMRNVRDLPRIIRKRRIKARKIEYDYSELLRKFDMV